jgi:type II secretory pathway predicted ATPase ExeA
MYEQFFNSMGLREDPFHVSPDPRFYYSTPAQEVAFTELMFGIETRKGLLVLTGEAGTGKTCLLNQITDWLHRRRRSTAYLFHTHLEPIGLLRFILNDFGVPCQSNSKSLLVSALHAWLLDRYAAQDLPVLILDEAQGLPLQTLDEVRLLLNLETPRGKLLQIILSGQPELEEKLRMPALRQLRQRVIFHSRLPLLTQKETAGYISRRLAAAGGAATTLFPDEVVRDIYASSRGIPRVVNLLCEHALFSAYAEQRQVVSPDMIHRIAMNFDLCANPLVVTDVESQPKFVRLAPFPNTQQLEPPPVAVEPDVNEKKVPNVPPAPTAEPPRFWRKHGSRPVMATFARDSAASIQNAGHTLMRLSASCSQFLRRILFRDGEKTRATSTGNPRSMANLWAQIDFNISERPRAAIYKQTQVAAKEPRVPGDSDAAPVKLPKHWRRHQSRPVMATFARTSAASVQRAWHALTDPFVRYSRSVSRSFVRDCRKFFRGLRQPTPVLALNSSPESANEEFATHQNVLASIVHWLREPFTPGNISGNRSRTRSAHRR